MPSGVYLRTITMHTGKYPRTEVHRKALALASRGNQSHLGYKHSEQARALMCRHHKGTSGLKLPSRKGRFNKEVLITLAIKSKQNWQNPEIRNKRVRGVMLALHKKPNKAEASLDMLLQFYFPNKYKFVGDGEVVIGGRCPDFLNIDGKKKIIELFGIYWHPIFDIAQRTEHYRNYGFSTLIVWEDELGNEPMLIKKIKNFTKKTSEE